jgi:hypothetical protein
MRKYRLGEHPLLLVRANMGIGKTEQLWKEVRRLPRDARIAVITYSIPLSKAYANSLTGLGFAHYSESKQADGSLTAPRLIVVSDSLWRVVSRQPPFDFVILDEALSILDHFNAETMAERRTSNLGRFAKLLLKAKNVVMVDAAVDNRAVAMAADWLAERKGVKPHWVRNSFVRMPADDLPPRQARLVKYKPNQSPLPAVLARLRANLEAGLKTVVACSSKTTVKALMGALSEGTPDKAIACVHADNKDEPQTRALIADPASTWPKLDVLIYSPSISAGVSFTSLHFDELIGVFMNGPKCPTVDTALQMMFRVRQLRAGHMCLFVQECGGGSGNKGVEALVPPATEALIPRWLDENIHRLHQAMFYVCPGDEEGFNKASLSYQLLKGIALKVGRSRRWFAEAIASTLPEDYKIPVEVVQAPKASGTPDAALAGTVKGPMLTEATWRAYVIDNERFQRLSRLKMQSEAGLSTLEAVQWHMHHILFEVIRLREKRVDLGALAPFEQLVGGGSRDVAAAYEALYQLNRFLRRDWDPSHARNDFRLQLEAYRAEEDNITYFHEMHNTHKQLGIKVGELWRRLFGGAAPPQGPPLGGGAAPPQAITMGTLQQVVRVWLDEQPDYLSIVHLTGTGNISTYKRDAESAKEAAGGDRQAAMKRVGVRKARTLVNSLLKRAYGMSLKTMRADHNRARQDQRVQVNLGPWQEYVTRYKVPHPPSPLLELPPITSP